MAKIAVMVNGDIMMVAEPKTVGEKKTAEIFVEIDGEGTYRVYSEGVGEGWYFEPIGYEGEVKWSKHFKGLGELLESFEGLVVSVKFVC